MLQKVQILRNAPSPACSRARPSTPSPDLRCARCPCPHSASVSCDCRQPHHARRSAHTADGKGNGAALAAVPSRVGVREQSRESEPSPVEPVRPQPAIARPARFRSGFDRDLLERMLAGTSSVFLARYDSLLGDVYIRNRFVVRCGIGSTHLANLGCRLRLTDS